jgi:hypothetical protein
VLLEEEKEICKMEDTFDLSEDLRTALGLQKETIITAGEYPVLITKEFVEIIFRIDTK